MWTCISWGGIFRVKVRCVKLLATLLYVVVLFFSMDSDVSAVALRIILV